MQVQIPIRCLLHPSLAVVVLAGATLAQMGKQVSPAQGALTDWALGLSIFDPSPPAIGAPAAGPLQVRAPAVQGGKPIPWTSGAFGTADADHPDFSFNALTYNWGVTIPSTFHDLFGGTSTGGDVTPKVDANGVIQPSSRIWYALNITVSDASQGELGSLINNVKSSTSHVGGHIFSYYPCVGTELPLVFKDTVRIEFTRQQLGLENQNWFGPDAEIRNLDFGVGVISVDSPNDGSFVAPVRDRFYFTISKHALNTFAFPQWVANQPVNASTIYCMDWDGVHWSVPSVAYSEGDLFGGPPASGSREIDAISVYRFGPPSALLHDRVVFSLTVESNSASGGPYDQLLVFQRSTSSSAPNCGTTAFKVKVDDGTNPPTNVDVSARIGLIQEADAQLRDPDEVRSGCGVDPRLPEPGFPAPLANEVIGVPFADSPIPDKPVVGLSAFRTVVPDPTAASGWISTMHYTITGFDPDATGGLVCVFQEEPTGLASLTGVVPLDPEAMANNIWRGSYTFASTYAPRLQHIVAAYFPLGLSSTPLADMRASWILELYH